MGESLGQKAERLDQIDARKFGFMPGRSTVGAVHALRILMQKYRERNVCVRLVFSETFHIVCFVGR